MTKKTSKPEFYSHFMKKGFFSDANKIIKFMESENYWIFKTGKKIYKIKKHEPVKSSASLEEIFCQEIVRRINTHSPELEPKLLTLKQEQQQYIFDTGNHITSPVLYYAIEMNQFADRYFFDQMLAKGKLKQSTIENIAHYLHQMHEQSNRSISKDEGTVDSLLQTLNDLIYQSKKYLGSTISQPMIDMTLHPLEKYINNNRKLLLRRLKKEKIREVHGCFIPRKIIVTKERIMALAKTSDPLKNRFKDIAADLADLTVELSRQNQQELAAHFTETYCKIDDDRDLKFILPIYEAFKCLALGLKQSIQFQKGNKKTAEEFKTKAKAYYEQAID